MSGAKLRFPLTAIRFFQLSSFAPARCRFFLVPTGEQT